MRSNADEIETFLISHVADLVQLAPRDINPEAPHAEHGLDSASALMLIADIEDTYHVRLSPSLAWDHPNLRSMARYLAQQLVQSADR